MALLPQQAALARGIDGAPVELLSARLLTIWSLEGAGRTADALAALEDGQDIGRVDLLTLADSGYAPSNPPEWIANLSPQLIVLNVKAGDENGMPSPQTLETTEGYQLLRTDLNGWIDVSTDGSQMWVSVEK